MDAPRTRAALYARVSTDDKGQTVENQRLPLREFCAAQGWTEFVEYTDEASATTARPEGLAPAAG